MTNEPILKEYYRAFLLNVRGVSESTVKHYYDALNKNSRLLVKIGKLEENIYEIHNLEKLLELKDILLANPEFQHFDGVGNHMYSSAMRRYCEFAEGHGFEKIIVEGKSIDAPMPVPEKDSTVSGGWKRSPIIRAQSLELATYQCEINPEHKTFIAINSDHMYMEGHHAIPMKLQGNFNHSLDVYANIVCLCPICHRLLHHGIKVEREAYMDRIYDKRVERLINSGLDIPKDKFREFAL